MYSQPLLAPFVLHSMFVQFMSIEIQGIIYKCSMTKLKRRTDITILGSFHPIYAQDRMALTTYTQLTLSAVSPGLETLKEPDNSMVAFLY